MNNPRYTPEFKGEAVRQVKEYAGISSETRSYAMSAKVLIPRSIVAKA